MHGHCLKIAGRRIAAENIQIRLALIGAVDLRITQNLRIGGGGNPVGIADVLIVLVCSIIDRSVLVSAAVDLATQHEVLHMVVDIGAGNIPHCVKQPLAGQHDSPIVDESQQKTVFQRRKKQILAVLHCRALFGIHHHITELYGLSRAAGEPENVFDAGKKLPRAKRLWDIIVGTQIEARNGAVFIAGGGQENNGDIKFGLDRSARGKAVPSCENDGIMMRYWGVGKRRGTELPGHISDGKGG